jgi:hypothetical protein
LEEYSITNSWKELATKEIGDMLSDKDLGNFLFEIRDKQDASLKFMWT